MYRWHTSAIGHRPLAHDVARVADGIAASLRQFSISATRAADEGKSASPDSRRQLIRNTAAELSSQTLSASKPAIDARALAASAPRLKITRVVEGSRSPSPNYRGRPSGAGFRPRGATGGPRRGARGGRGGRGGARGNARGRGAQGPRKRAARDKEYDDAVDLKVDLETYGDHPGVRVMPKQVETPYKPTSTLNTLTDFFPAVASSNSVTSQVESIQERMRLLGRQNPHSAKAPPAHIETYFKGDGTLFQGDDELKYVQFWVKERGLTDMDQVKWKREAEAIGRDMGPIETLEESERSEILKSLVAGEYQKVQDSAKGSTMPSIENYAARNSAYLTANTTIMRDKVQSMLPKGPVAPKGKAPQGKKAPAKK